MTPNTVQILALSSLVISAACGSGGDPYVEELQQPSTGGDQVLVEMGSGSAAERVIAEVTIADEEYTFLELIAQGETTLMVRTIAPPGRSSSMDQLRTEAGVPTLLESFRALAPAAAPSPPELVESHPEEASALGRPDASVLDTTVDKQAAPIGNPCADESFFFANVTWVNQRRVPGFNTSYACVSAAGQPDVSALGLPTATSCRHSSTRRMMAGTCIFPGGAPKPAVEVFAGYGSATSWATTSATTMVQGDRVRYDFPASTTPRRLAVIGVGPSSPESNYPLRTGEAL
jgi:hypothetical protein